jgi:hypothetical protein
MASVETSPHEGAASAPAGSDGASLALPALELESMESLLASDGFERAERLGRFLLSAEPADLERLLLGWKAQRGQVEVTLAEAVFLRWMTVEAAGGLTFAGQHGYVGVAWWAWGKTHPDAALAAALKETDPKVGSMVLRAIAQNDPLRARQLLEHYPQFQEAPAMSGLASGLMRVDPAAGATLAAAWHDAIDDENLISAWARRDPEAALAWAQALPDSTRRAEAMGVLLDQWAAVHPEKVGPAIAALPEGAAKWKLYADHAKRLAAIDPERARAWVDAAPTPLLRNEATIELARGLAATDAGAALEVLRGLDWSLQGETVHQKFLLTPGSASLSGENPSFQVIMEISAAAPAESLAFVASLPPEARVEDLARAAFGSWLQRDSLSASEWLADQPAGVLRQIATEKLARHLIGEVAPDFEAAAHWALTLPVENGVNGVVREVFGEWRSRDREAAQAFLDQSACHPKVREVILLVFANR